MIWLGRNIKEHWENWLKALLKKKQNGVLLVATPEQKKTIKKYILEEIGGFWGWDIITRGELERREGSLGLWELKMIGRAWEDDWVGVDEWAEALMEIGVAGGVPEDFFKENILRELSENVFSAMRQLGLRAAWQVELRVDVAVGFDPRIMGIYPSLGIGFLTGQIPSAAQARAIETWEKKFAYEQEVCEMNGAIEQILIETDTAGDLLEATKECLVKRRFSRVVYSGDEALGIVAALFKNETQGWWERAFLADCRKTLEEKAFYEEWMKSAIANKFEEKEALEQLRINRKQQWKKDGAFVAIEPAFCLPPKGSIEEFTAACAGFFPERTQSFTKRLSLIKKMLPKEVSREWYLEGLEQMDEKETAAYEEISVVPFERAQGLFDNETLVLWSRRSAPEVKIEKLAAELARWNLEQKDPRMWARTDNAEELFAMEELAKENCSWAKLANSVELPSVQKRIYKAQKSFAEELQKKHATRNNAANPFGPNDYALEPPLRASAKTWEEIFTQPEVCWYKLIGLLPKDWSEKMIIGEWVHEALAVWASTPKRKSAFEEDNSSDALRWLCARAQAKRLALDFQKALSGVRVLEIEKKLRGVWLGVDLVGVADQLVEVNGERVVVDFKTGSSKKISDFKEADGLQLLLYARLLGGRWGLCRFSKKTGFSIQRIVSEEEVFECEKEMAQKAQSGVLGQQGGVFSPYAKAGILPQAAWAVDPVLMERRRHV